MKNYHFLMRPAFYIFSLVAGSWLVLKIEKLSPSDFGKYRALFEREDKTMNDDSIKAEIKSLANDFKFNKIDQVEFEKRIEKLMRDVNDKPKQ